MFPPDSVPNRPSARLYRAPNGVSAPGRGNGASHSSGRVVGNRRASRAVGRKPLGRNAKLGTPLDLNEITSSVNGGDDGGVPVEDGRRRRFRLQARARYLLRNSRRKSKKGDLQPYRIHNCLLVPGLQSAGAAVAKTSVPDMSGTIEYASYRGLQVCGSVWHCPVCAAKVSMQRCIELKNAILRAAELGYKVVMVTYTARHDYKTVLKDQLEAMTEAHRAVWRGETAKRLKEQFGVLGMIRTLECTHGRNGWHPHIHALIFVPNDCDVVGFGSALRLRWELMALKSGLTMNKHGFDIQDNAQKVADYIAKWGHFPSWSDADELARWHTKIGRGRDGNEHYTPWQLLDFADHGDEKAGELWKEYALTYYNRKQLHWSPGLRKKLGMLKEETDEELAEKESEDAKTLYEIRLNHAQWGWIKGNDMRVELLELVEKCSADEVIDRCKKEYGFEPELILPGDLQKEAVVTAEDKEALRIARIVEILENTPNRRVVTPDGAGAVSLVTRCPILKRWRCTVFLDAGKWIACDVANIRLI